MSFDWSEYLKVARELVGEDTSPPSQEAKLRSAIGRAYYAAFIKARNFLRDRSWYDNSAGEYAPVCHKPIQA